MGQRIISVNMVSSIHDMKSAMFTTMNKEAVGVTAYKKGSDKTVHRMMLNTHSPCNAVIFKVRALVTDRTHTHLRTHSGMSNIYFCGSSRPDLSHGEDLDGYRLIEFMVDAKRFIEISQRRLCPSAWKDTRVFWTDLCKEVFKIIPELEVHAVRPCVNRGFCVEGMTDCNYTFTPAFSFERQRQLELAQSLRKSADSEDWVAWKKRYC